jgi:hypothetical protein
MQGFPKQCAVRALVVACAALTLAPVVNAAEAVRTVSGIVQFEKRRTLTPQICTNEGCVKPQPYWAVVLADAGARYELDQAFDIGRDSRPDSVDLDNVELRPGLEVAVEGQVDVLNREYSIVSDVRNVEIIRLIDSTLEGAPFFGWTCRSQGEALPMYVDVEQVSRSGGYAMRVLAETDDSSRIPHTVASFNQVTFRLEDAALHFHGAASDSSAELSIDQSSGRLDALNSVLELRAPREYPSGKTVQLVCDRTR